MDFLTLSLFRFHLSYFLGWSFAWGGIWGLGFALAFPKEKIFAFWIGTLASCLWQLGVLELRVLARFSRFPKESKWPMASVFLSFLGNLGILFFLTHQKFPPETTFGFLIAYFLHLMLLVFASYCSVPKNP